MGFRNASRISKRGHHKENYRACKCFSRFGKVPEPIMAPVSVWTASDQKMRLRMSVFAVTRRRGSEYGVDKSFFRSIFPGFVRNAREYPQFFSHSSA